MTFDLQNPSSNTCFNSVTQQRNLKRSQAKEYEQTEKKQKQNKASKKKI
jgi:hypothetical protein